MVCHGRPLGSLTPAGAGGAATGDGPCFVHTALQPGQLAWRTAVPAHELLASHAEADIQMFVSLPGAPTVT